MGEEDLPDNMSNTIDLGNYTTAQPYDNISYSSGVDTITLDMTTLTNTISIPAYTTTASNASTYSIGTSYGANGSYYINNPTTNISGNGIELGADADIKIGGKSFKDILSKIEDRLAILTPDTAKLEKFAALKKAYDNYKLIEKLCHEDEEKK